MHEGKTVRLNLVRLQVRRDAFSAAKGMSTTRQFVLVMTRPLATEKHDGDD